MCHNIVSPVNKCMITIILSSVSLLRLVLWSSPCSSKIIPSPFVQDFDASSSKASSPQSPSHSPNYDSMLHKEPKCIIITIININITIIIIIKFKHIWLDPSSSRLSTCFFSLFSWAQHIPAPTKTETLFSPSPNL